MIIWFVNKIDLKLASFRYRALWMARATAKLGIPCLVTDDDELVRSQFSNQIDTIIFSKSFNTEGFELAWAAKKAEIPIVIDLCDNIFIHDYLGGIKGYQLLSRFYSMQHIADMIVVPTTKLKEVVAQHVSDSQSIQVIPDGIETSDDIIDLIKKNELSDESEIHFNDHLTIAVKAKRKKHLFRKTKLNNTTRYSECGANQAGMNNRFNVDVVCRLLNRMSFALKNPDKIAPYVKKRMGWDKQVYRKVIGEVLNANSDSSALHEPEAEQAKVSCKKILWFGNAGDVHGDYGIATIIRHADALKRINQEIPVELVIVSNNINLFNDYIKPLPIKTTYVEWDPLSVFQHLKAADVCIVPNSGDRFSQTKSANRVILSLTCGTPVVADDFSSLNELKDCIAIGDWDHGLRRYLVENNSAGDLENAKSVISEHYSDESLANKWQQLFTKLKAKDARSKTTVLVVLDLIQDLEIVKPILRHLREQNALRLKVLVTSWLVAHSPRVLSFLKELNLVAEVKDRNSIINGENAYLTNVDAILLPTETNLNPHRVSHHIAKQAKGAIRTITFQHGLENVGLSYFDAHSVSFASDMIITWNDHIQNNPKIESSVKDRCIPLGMFKEISQGMTPQQLHEKVGAEKVVGIFENLHWDRYNDQYRSDFLENLVKTATRFPEICFLIKPHHAGVWLNKILAETQVSVAWPQNIYVVDIADSFWEQYTGNQIVGACDAVITTPSTIAVDSSLCGVPVAVFAKNLTDLSSFGPLTLLNEGADWTEFISTALDSNSVIKDGVDLFRNRTIKTLNPLEEFNQLVLRK